MLRKNSITGILLLISSCATGPYPVTSPYFQIPIGSYIELNQALTVTPNRGRVYLQYGKVVTEKEKDNYQPHCWFLSWKVLETPQTINPDVFTVMRSQKDEEIVRNLSNIKLASNTIETSPGIETTIGKGRNTNRIDDSAPLAVIYTTQIHIHSEKQADIRLLECSHWDDPNSGDHLTVDQMQQALGKIATIIIKK